MVTVNSVSGGKTSAYIAKHYPADYNIFALVRTNKKDCIFKDKKLRQVVSDKIGKEFIGTLEMDEIIYTMLDLEQFIGSKISWVSGLTFEELIELPENNVLPSPIRRYCTALLKQVPIFEWWQKNINEVVDMRIGFRANETRRANNMLKRLNKDGVIEEHHVIGKHKNGNNKWTYTPWQVPSFPLINKEAPVYKDMIDKYWINKPVRFAVMNNCVGCFHRSPILLKKMWDSHPNKMQFFSDLEKDRKYPNDTLKGSKITYEQIKNWRLQHELSFDDFNTDEYGCDSGYCGL